MDVAVSKKSVALVELLLEHGSFENTVRIHVNMGRYDRSLKLMAPFLQTGLVVSTS